MLCRRGTHHTLGSLFPLLSVRFWGQGAGLWANSIHHQHSEREQVVIFNCLDFNHQPPSSRARQYKSRTVKGRFEPIWRAWCRAQGTAVERMRHINDSHGQILALASRPISRDPFLLFPLRSDVEGENRCRILNSFETSHHQLQGWVNLDTIRPTPQLLRPE